MSAPRIVVFPVFVCCLSFLKYSISEKREDCKRGKQYWSVSDILHTGTCARCPANWKNCYEQPIEDQESCALSCRDSAKPKPKANSTTITSTITPLPLQPTPSKVPKITINSNASSAVVYPLAKHPPEVNEVQKTHVVKEGFGKEVWIAVGSGFIVLILTIILTIVLCHKIKKKSVGHRGEAGGINAGEQMVLEPLQPGRNDPELQEAPRHPLEINVDVVPEEEQIGRQEEELSTTRIGGIQDTEGHNFSSAVKLNEKFY